MTSDVRRGIITRNRFSTLLFWFTRVWWALPVLLAGLLLLPRLLTPQFGLMDDGVTVMNAQRITAGSWSIGWEAATGRYRPAYWLYYAFIYWIAGPSPFFFFLGNLLLLVGAALLLMSVLRAAGGSRLHALLAGVLFVLSGPVIENYYTLSKGEPLQLMGVLAALRLAQLAGKAGAIWQKAVLWLAVSLALLAAVMTKETTLVMVPVALTWAGLTWLWTWRRGERFRLIPAVQGRLGLAAAALSAGLIFLVLRRLSVEVGLTEGGYTSLYELGLRGILASAFRWTGWLGRDLPYLAPLVLFTAITAAWKHKFPQGLFVAQALVWMAAWMAIFLPWEYTVEYYMLPLMAGAAALAGLLVDWTAAHLFHSVRSVRLLSAGCLALAGAALLVSLLNNASNARLQLAVDAANRDMLTYTALHIPHGGLLYVNLPAYNEYVYEIELHLKYLYNRNDIRVDRYQFNRPQLPQASNYWVVSPEIENQPLLTVRMGVYEQGVQDWNTALRQFLGKAGPRDLVERTFRLTNVDFLRLLCPLFSSRNYCTPPYLIFDNRLLAYRWYIYEVDIPSGSLALPGRFHDGLWTLLLPDGSLKNVQFGMPGDTPLAGDWNGDGLTDLGVYRPGNQTFYFDFKLAGQPDQELQLEGMLPGDLPVVGDWNGDGVDTPAFYRPDSGTWYFRLSLTSGPPDLPPTQAGGPGDLPLAGDWDGDGITGIGIYRPDSGEVNLEDSLDVINFSGVDFLLPPNIQPVFAAWNPSRAATAAVVDGETWVLMPGNCDCNPSNPPRPFIFAPTEGVPVAGFWR